MKLLINIVLVCVLLATKVVAHEDVKVVVVPMAGGAPFMSLQEALTALDPGKALVARQEIIQRCNDTQDARLEGCVGQACTDAAHAKALCDSLPSELTEGEMALGILPCNGVVPVVQCGGGNPSCPLGKDVDGDGVNDTCKSGQRCNPASEGAQCDAGVLYDCFLHTTYYPSVKGCDCNCE